MNTLERWRNDRKKEVAKFNQKADLDLVFPTQRVTVQQYTNIRKQQPIPLMKEAGVVDEEGKAKYTDLHSFWHLYCSWLLNRKEAGGLGLLLQEAQKRMGHSTLAMTCDLYGHLFP